MRFTAWGAREIAISALFFALGVLLLVVLSRRFGSALFLAPLPLLLLLFGWVLWFFRDPPRDIPQTPGCIVSPADGTVTHVDTAEEGDYIGGAALRCSIFLSIFSVHINRAPAAGTVEFVQFRPGAFHDARSEESLSKNQNQDIGLAVSEPGLPAKMVVRQSTGAIAKTIVCPVRHGDRLRRGEKYGMIKFGSRTTLFLSPDAGVEWLVKPGDAVRAGETVLARARAEHPVAKGTE